MLTFLSSVSAQTVLSKEMAELIKRARNSEPEVGKVFAGKEDA